MVGTRRHRLRHRPYPARMRRIRQVGCGTCGAAWPAQTARYCGRCGAVLGADASAPGPVDTPWRRLARPQLAALVTVVVAAATALVTIAGPLAGDAAPGTDVTGVPPSEGPADVQPRSAAPDTAAAGASVVVDVDPRRRTRTDPARWRTRFDADITALTVAERTVVVGTADGALHHIDGDHGTRSWIGSMGAAPRALHLDDDRVVVGTDDGRLVAVDADSGNRRWETQLDPEHHPTTITGSDAGLLVTVGPSRDRELVALDPRDGQVRWRRDLPPATVEVGGSSVLLTGTALEGWDAARPSPRWRLEVGAGERLVGRTDRYVVTRDAAGTRLRNPATGRVEISAGPDAPWWIRSTATDCLEVEGCLEDLTAAAADPFEVVGVSGTTTVLVSRPRAVEMTDAPASAPNAAGIDDPAPSGVRGVSRSDRAHRWRFGDADVLVSIDPLIVAGQRVAIGPPLDADAAASARAATKLPAPVRARIPWPLAQPNALSPR